MSKKDRNYDDFAEAERRAESPEEEWVEFDENKTAEEYVDELLQLHKEGKLKLKADHELKDND
ncbi:hypothetical protein [Metabacillus schmidteae]|uniref:hypothetical protein n=1 Tax=Metabacillus schmidteae TaxID=2730405 RepID=UPI00158E14D3|nr:hypothetical protein [Metabacillus schmidteae]